MLATAHRLWFRIAFAALVLDAGTIRVWALFAPQSFFASFPGFGRTWVAMLPPYNEHLVRDVGALNLAFAVLFLWAAVTMGRSLARMALVAWLVSAVPHLFFHLGHLEHFSTADAAAQIVGLSLVVVVPLVLLIVLAVGRSESVAAGV